MGHDDPRGQHPQAGQHAAADVDCGQAGRMARAPGREVTIDGFLVPRVEVGEDPATGLWCLFLDRRYGTPPVDIDELHRWLPMIANALAIGAGYSCHGENSVWRQNPHKVRVSCVGAVQSNDEPDGGVPVEA